MQRCPLPSSNKHTFLTELVPGIINPETVSVLIHTEDAWKVTRNTISFCGELPSFSMFSALPSVWSINLYLWQQFTLILKICKPFCPAVFSTLICNTVGRVYSKQSGHPVSFKLCFTEDEHAVCFISESLYKCVLYKVMTFYSVPRIKNKNTKKAMTIVFCHYLQNFPTEGQRVFSLF